MSDETSVAEATTTTAAQPDLTPDELIAAMESSFRDFNDGDRIDANLINGVLTLTIAKKAAAKPRKIEIKR